MEWIFSEVVTCSDSRDWTRKRLKGSTEVGVREILELVGGASVTEAQAGSRNWLQLIDSICSYGCYKKT